MPVVDHCAGSDRLRKLYDCTTDARFWAPLLSTLRLIRRRTSVVVSVTWGGVVAQKSKATCKVVADGSVAEAPSIVTQPTLTHPATAMTEPASASDRSR